MMHLQYPLARVPLVLVDPSDTLVALPMKGWTSSWVKARHIGPSGPEARG